MTRPEHIRANIRASDKGPLTPADIERLKAHRWHHDYWV